MNSLIPEYIGWDSSVSIHYEETVLYWSPCSLNYCLVHSGEFHPNNLQYSSDHHFGCLSLQLETMHYKTHSSDLLWDPLNRRRPKLARTTSFINSLDNALVLPFTVSGPSPATISSDQNIQSVYCYFCWPLNSLPMPGISLDQQHTDQHIFINSLDNALVLPYTVSGPSPATISSDQNIQSVYCYFCWPLNSLPMPGISLDQQYTDQYIFHIMLHQHGLIN